MDTDTVNESTISVSTDIGHSSASLATTMPQRVDPLTEQYA